jgi:hypothetical protein
MGKLKMVVGTLEQEANAIVATFELPSNSNTMGAKDIRMEINRSLDRMPERVLTDILELLQQVERKQTDGKLTDARLSEILCEDRSLLQRLAQ